MGAQMVTQYGYDEINRNRNRLTSRNAWVMLMALSRVLA